MGNNTFLGSLGRALLIIAILAGDVIGLNWAFDWMDQKNSTHNIIGLFGFLLILAATYLIIKRIFKTKK